MIVYQPSNNDSSLDDNVLLVSISKIDKINKSFNNIFFFLFIQRIIRLGI